MSMSADVPTPPPELARRLRPLPALIFSSRWLQLPLYLGLIVAQCVYVFLFLKELIRTPSQNPPGDTAAVAELAAKTLKSLGFGVERHDVPDGLVRERGHCAITNLVVRHEFASGPVVAQVLEGENAIENNREVMGATNPAEAAPGTIRALYAESIEANSVHGSDALETAATEISFFFSEDEIVG